MSQPSNAILYLDAERLQRALRAGIRHVISRKNHINKINVFPVPDSDTGTNLVFTLNAVLEAQQGSRFSTMAELLKQIAEAALDGSRGNSGAIMAQFFQGFRESAQQLTVLRAPQLAVAAASGARSAWGALAEPVEGTLPTVLRDFGDELKAQVAKGVQDIRELFARGLERARISLANTPQQLPVLRQAGVVDAGGQGFVDLLEGIWGYIEDGRVDDAVEDDEEPAALAAEVHLQDTGGHRFCTECLISGSNIDHGRLREHLTGLDCSSLVVAGSKQRVRVHIHVDSPAQVFLACETFGRVTRQKADDMQQQQRVIQQRSRVMVVTDSGADIPEDELERLDIHMVPVRLMFGDQDYLDKVSITPPEFYDKLSQSDEYPKTSQPPPGDFRRQYELLTSHGHQVVSIGVSRKLSGTLQAAESAAAHYGDRQVSIVNSLNASTGQGLVVLAAAEAAAAGMSARQVKQTAESARGRSRSYALVQDMSWGVRGGRIPAWAKKLVDWLHVNLLLTNTGDGRLAVRGVVFGKRDPYDKFARQIVRKLDQHKLYRVLIGHCQAEAVARRIQQYLLEHHGRMHSCMITDAGPAVGVHLGPGGLVVGVQEYVPVTGRG